MGRRSLPLRRRRHQVGFEGRATPGATARLRSLEATVYVVEDAKLLYVQVFKAACTSMLWALAQLQGASPAGIGSSRALHVTKDLRIHDRGLHPVPTIDQVDPGLREEALTSPDWMRLAVIRDPYERFYSGWESRKLLLHHGPWDAYPHPELVYVDGGRRLDVAASFRAFAVVAAEHRDLWQQDFHFAQQVALLALDEVDYTDLVTTAQLPRLFTRLGERVGRPIDPGRRNEGLGITAEQVLDAPTAAICEELFADDFAQLGFPRRRFSRPAGAVLDPAGTSLLHMIDQRNLRIEDLVGQLAIAEGHR